MTTFSRLPSPQPTNLPDPSELDDPNIKLPDAIDYIRRLNAAVELEIGKRSADTTPIPQILMISPSGVVFKVTISDSGVLSSTVLYSP